MEKKMKPRRLVKTLIPYCVLIVIAGIFLVFYRPSFLWGDTYYLPVLSGSMEPTIPVGGVVVIQQTDPATLHVGDIICFKLSDSQLWVTHRIVNITDEGFITKGDANNVADRWVVERENVVGKVLFTIPYLAYFGSFVHTPLGFLLLIMVPATLIIIDETKNIAKNRKGEKGGEN
jgi:signal peptidase